MNRTRRRDIGPFTQREPRTVEVPFTTEQRSFYEGLVTWRRQVLEVVHGPLVANLVISQIERQASSCLFGVGEGLAAVASTGSVTRNRSEDDEDEELEGTEEVQLPEGLALEASRLLEEFNALPSDDPKLEELLAVVREALAEPPAKLLVFTFFRRTLRYLGDALEKQRIRFALVHGDVPDDDRQELRARFRLDRADPRALDVLVSTEVGAGDRLRVL